MTINKTLREGAIIRRKTINPFITHAGILIIENDLPVVYHNISSEKNDYGGNIIISSLEDFFRKGEFISYKNTSIKSKDVKRYYHNNIHRRYHLIKYNCEDFISEITTGKKGSNQRMKYILISGISATLFAIRKYFIRI